MNKVILRQGRDRSVAAGHPWIFSGAVASGDAAPGETVEVLSSHGERLGYGSFSPASQIRVRMMAFGEDAAEPTDSAVHSRVAAAVAARSGFAAGDPARAVRLVNAENDFLPGVTVDFYAGWAVCQFTSAGAERWKTSVAEALTATVPGCRGVCERADAESRAREGLPVGGFSVMSGEEPPELVEIREGSSRYLVDVRKGHKTGFYLDQRAARALAGILAKGRTVLNCFSYTGGFGIAAALGGAAAVENVDSSGAALALARRNFGLNGLGGSAAEFVEADVFAHLRRCRDSGRKFGMIVLDPPKFADAKAGVMKASRAYKDINLLAMKLLEPGGILATFSCSGAMTRELFDRVLAGAAVDAKREVARIAETTQDFDHPVLLSFPEGLYLKGSILRVR